MSYEDFDDDDSQNNEDFSDAISKIVRAFSNTQFVPFENDWEDSIDFDVEETVVHVAMDNTGNKAGWEVLTFSSALQAISKSGIAQDANFRLCLGSDSFNIVFKPNNRLFD